MFNMVESGYVCVHLRETPQVAAHLFLSRGVGIGNAADAVALGPGRGGGPATCPPVEMAWYN